jgi:hypothetical protein
MPVRLVKAKNAVKYQNFAQNDSCGDFVSDRKKFTFLKATSKYLCKLMMNKPMKTPCGKLLWKNLWRVWKSWGFPQANRKNPATKG